MEPPRAEEVESAASDEAAAEEDLAGQGFASEEFPGTNVPGVELASVDFPAPVPPACGTLVLTASGSQHLGRLPYLQQVSATEARVLFTTREPEEGITLELSSLNGERRLLTRRDPADPTGRQRFVRLTGLQPASDYCYELPGWTRRVRFRTPPLGETPATSRFVVFGDSGGDSRELVRDAIARNPFDLLLHVGDIAYPRSSLENLEERFFDTYAELLASVPFFPASGNHEYYADGAAPFRQVFDLPNNGSPYGAERWYSFDWGPVHFVALDTERVGTEQAEWLDRDLERNELPWKVVYMHRPPFSSGKHGGAENVRETFSPLFERHGVPLVLAGHDHDYERTRVIGGVTYVVTGGGGHSVRPVGSSDFTVRSLSVFHFVRGEVSGQKLLLEAVDTEGAVFDSFELQKPAP